MAALPELGICLMVLMFPAVCSNRDLPIHTLRLWKVDLINEIPTAALLALSVVWLAKCSAFFFGDIL